MHQKCAPEGEEKLCTRCLEAGGLCGGCVRSLLPRIAMNGRWLKLIKSAAAHRVNPLLETRSADAAVAKAERRNANKAKKAQVGRISRLVSGQLARACPTRPVFAPLPS